MNLFVVIFIQLWVYILGLPTVAVHGSPSGQPARTISEQTAHDTIAVWRVYFESQSELAELTAIADPWEVDFVQGFLLTPLQPEQVEPLNRQFRLEIDAQATARLSALRHIRAANSDAFSSGIPGYACYRTVEETYTTMSSLALRFPQFATWTDIGDSWSKTAGSDGYDLRVLVLTNHALQHPKFKFFLVGAVHARELTTSETATRFAEMLLDGYGVDPDITWLLDYGEVHILPVANPDGRKFAEQLVSWRKNTNTSQGQCTGGFAPFSYGVDLNRNSSYRWNQCSSGACSSGDPCAATYRGPAPASEPETQAIQSYLSNLFPAANSTASADAPTGIFISLHSYGEWVLFPWGYTTDPAPDMAALRTLGRKFGYFTGYRVCQSGAAGCLYPTDGTTDDWVYGELGVPAFTFELGTWFFQSCSEFEQSIVEPALDALLLAFKAARLPFQEPLGPDIVKMSPAASQIVAGQPFTLTISADDMRFASNGYGDEPSQPIAAIRVGIGTPLWSAPAAMTSTVPNSLTEAIVTAKIGVPSAPTTVGRHLAFAQAMDSDGNWGLPTALFLTTEHPSLRTAANSTLRDNGTARAGDSITFTIAVTYTALATTTHIVQDVVLSTDWRVAQNQWPVVLEESTGCQVQAVEQEGNHLRWRLAINGEQTDCEVAFAARLAERPTSPTSTITVTTTDLDYASQPIVHTFVAAIAPTALSITSVEVEKISLNSAAITWQIADSLHTWGFHIWRAASKTRVAAIRVTPAPILAADQQSTFHFEDHTAVPDHTTTYWIEALSHSGDSAYYGPFPVAAPPPRQRYLPFIYK